MANSTNMSNTPKEIQPPRAWEKSQVFKILWDAIKDLRGNLILKDRHHDLTEVLWEHIWLRYNWPASWGIDIPGSFCGIIQNAVKIYYPMEN